jgi:hypothetical protein
MLPHSRAGADQRSFSLTGAFPAIAAMNSAINFSTRGCGKPKRLWPNRKVEDNAIDGPAKIRCACEQ